MQSPGDECAGRLLSDGPCDKSTEDESDDECGDGAHGSLLPGDYHAGWAPGILAQIEGDGSDGRALEEIIEAPEVRAGVGTDHPVKRGAAQLHTTFPLSQSARVPPVPDLPRFYVTQIDHPPAPYAVRDRHLRATRGRHATIAEAEEARARAERWAAFERTPLRDYAWAEERAVVPAER